MSHNLKTTKEHLSCGSVSVTSYCGPMLGKKDRSRVQVTQDNVTVGAFSNSSLNLTKKQARDLATTLLAWSDNT